MTGLPACLRIRSAGTVSEDKHDHLNRGEATEPRSPERGQVQQENGSIRRFSLAATAWMHLPAQKASCGKRGRKGLGHFRQASSPKPGALARLRPARRQSGAPCTGRGASGGSRDPPGSALTIPPQPVGGWPATGTLLGTLLQTEDPRSERRFVNSPEDVHLPGQLPSGVPQRTLSQLAC